VLCNVPRRVGRLAAQAASCRRGNVAVVFALATPLVIGGAALSVETSYQYNQHTKLQAAADAAAYAGALEDRAGSSVATITSAATATAIANGWSATGGAIQVNTPPTSGANRTSNAVEVVLISRLPRFFTALFVPGPLSERTRAVAIYQTAADACVLALSKSAPQSVQVQGSAALTLSGCDVMSNSVASDAVNVWGSAKLSADCVVSVGGITNKGGLTVTGCPGPITQAPRAADPFAGLPVPSPGAKQTVPNGPATLSPGWYSKGMNLSGTYTLQPGVYYVSGNDLKIGANASVSGAGVTIFLAAGSQVNMNGNATANLSAPTSGPYSGILFFGDPASTGGDNQFNGTASSSLQGDLYFPTQQVTYQGNFSSSNGCMQIVADTVVWTGNATVSVDCSAEGMTPIPARLAVKVVE
jgi:Flp pilus assembly protein TadG